MSAILHEYIKRGSHIWNIYREVIQWIQYLFLIEENNPLGIARWLGTLWPEQGICQKPIIFITLRDETSVVCLLKSGTRMPSVTVSIWQKKWSVRINRLIELIRVQHAYFIGISVDTVCRWVSVDTAVCGTSFPRTVVQEQAGGSVWGNQLGTPMRLWEMGCQVASQSSRERDLSEN